MRRPRNAYETGVAVRPELHAIGRPVAFYSHAGVIEAATIVALESGASGELFYDVQIVGGGRYGNVRLGDLNNPQPNTFTYAP